MANQVLVKTFIENTSIAPLVLELFELIVESPEEVEQIIDDSSAMVECIQTISGDTFFQRNICDELRAEISEVANFVSEAARQKDFLMSNKLTIPSNMLADPGAVSLESLAHLFEIGLCRYLTFVELYYAFIRKEYPEVLESIDKDRLKSLLTIISEIGDSEILQERRPDHLKESFEELVNVRFVSYEDTMRGAEVEANMAMEGASEEEIDAAVEVAMASDYVNSWE